MGPPQLPLSWEVLVLTLKIISLQTGDVPRVPDWIEISGLPSSRQKPHKAENLLISTGQGFCKADAHPAAQAVAGSPGCPSRTGLLRATVPVHEVSYVVRHTSHVLLGPWPYQWSVRLEARGWTGRAGTCFHLRVRQHLEVSG